MLALVAACGGGKPKASGTFVAAAVPSTTIDPAFGSLKRLLGAWEGQDENKHSMGRFTLEVDLGGKILLRRNADDTDDGHHEDLMVIYKGASGLRASYWDNEGHAIAYAVTASGDHIELVSDEVPGSPRFKLTYDFHGDDEVKIDFSIAPPGSKDFKHYIGGTVHRAPH